MRKLVPLKNALSGYDAWISGIRVAQSITRNETKLLEHDKIFHLLKLNPIALFSDADVERYIKENTIPSNSLYAKAFLYRMPTLQSHPRGVKIYERVDGGGKIQNTKNVVYIKEIKLTI